jgi:hypothetical protein
MSTAVRNAARFVLYTYAISWLLWLPAILQSRSGKGIDSAWYVIGMVGLIVPSIVGLVFLRREQKDWRLVKALFRFRLNRWMALAFVILPASMVVAHWVNITWFDGPAPVIAEPSSIPLRFLSILVMGGPLIEEIGWRGYLQPRVNERYRVIMAGLIVGVIWAIWHFPLFLVREMFHHNLPLDQFFITAVLMSVIMNFFLVKAQSGIWPALVLHTFMNLTQELTPLFNDQGHNLWIITNGVLLVVVVYMIFIQARKQNPD